MPCFLKRPFSTPITNGEQAVKTMMPTRISVTFGESLAKRRPDHPQGTTADTAAKAEWRKKRWQDRSREGDRGGRGKQKVLGGDVEV